MPPAKTKRLVYDDWSGGEFGTMNPAKAPNGTWTGLNMVVYRNGRIGPRPGLKKIALSSNPPQFGPMLGMGFSPTAQTGNEQIFFILDDDVYSFDPDDLTLVTVTGTLASAPPANSDADTVLSKESVRLIGDEVYIVIDNDKPYRINMRTGVLSAITTPGPAQGTDIELYQDRMLIANGSNRVYYSDAADFNTWQSGSFFDVAASYRIISMMTFRDALYIFTQSGTWALTGPPDTGTLRRVSETLSPYDKSVVLTNDELVYIPASRNAPVIFNGSYGDERVLEHLETWKNDSVGAYGVQSYGNRDVLFHSNNGDLLWRKNGAWTQHDFGVGAQKWITRWFDDNVVVADPGGASEYPTFYMLPMNIERPVIEGTDSWGRPGDDSATPLDAYFTIPDYLSPDGYECRVRSVTVDFLSYDTGLTSSNPNNIDIVLTSLGRERIDGDSSTAGQTGLYSDDPNNVSASGTYCRRVYRGTTQSFGAGFRLKLDDIVGVAIDRVIVEIEEQEVPVT